MQSQESSIGKRYGMLTVVSEFCKWPKGNTRSYYRKYVLAICDCGNVKQFDRNSLRQGHTKSCGCLIGKLAILRGRLKSRKSPDAMFQMLYRKYRIEAKNRGLDFKLTAEQFKSLTLDNCYICGSPPNQIWEDPVKDWRTRLWRKPYIYNGIDRYDNSIGYTNENSRTCCKKCNYLKKQDSYENTVSHAYKIVSYQEKLKRES